MNRKMLGILTVVTALVVALAAFAYSRRAVPTTDAADDTLLLPALGTRINDVATVALTGAETSVRIERGDDGWTLKEKGGYPVEFERVKETLVGLADLEIVETKTSRPELYDRIGVNAPDEPGAESTLVTLEDAEARPIASVIVGRLAGATRGAQRHYVRRADEAQSYLAEGDIAIDSSPMSWVKKDVSRIGRARVRSATITHPDGERVHTHRPSRDDNNFVIDDIPEGRELISRGAGGMVSGALAYLQLEDVRPAAELPLNETPATTAEFRLFNGVIVTVQARTIEDITWLVVEAARDEEGSEDDAGSAETAPDDASDDPDPDEEVAELNALWRGWAYAVNAAQAANLTKRMAEVTKEIAPEAPASEAGTETPPKAGYVFPDPKPGG
jgi:hypothetical protein